MTETTPRVWANTLDILQRLVDEKIFTSASVEVDLDIVIDYAFREEFGPVAALGEAINDLVDNLPDDVVVGWTVITDDGPSHWPLVRFVARPRDMKALLTAYDYDADLDVTEA